VGVGSLAKLNTFNGFKGGVLNHDTLHMLNYKTFLGNFEQVLAVNYNHALFDNGLV